MISIVRGSDGFAGERERETLEILMLTPATGPQLAAGKLFGILASWGILFALGAPYLWAVGQRGGNFLPALRYLCVTGTLLVMTFSSLALALSAKVKSFKSVLSIGLTILLLSASPVLLGPSLRQNAAGQLMDILNPFANALNILDSVVIDGQGIGLQTMRLATMLGWALLALFILHVATKKVQI
jgi:ABC-type Na+ efflux pump permease subunit